MCNHSLKCLWFGWGYHDLGNLHVVDVGMFFDVQQWMTMDVAVVEKPGEGKVDEKGSCPLSLPFFDLVCLVTP